MKKKFLDFLQILWSRNKFIMIFLIIILIIISCFLVYINFPLVQEAVARIFHGRQNGLAQQQNCLELEDLSPLQGPFNVAMAYIGNPELASAISDGIEKVISKNSFFKRECIIEEEDRSEFATKLNADLLILSEKQYLEYYIHNPSEGTEGISIYEPDEIKGTEVITFTDKQKTDFTVKFVYGIKLLFDKQPLLAIGKFDEACAELYKQGGCPTPDNNSVGQNTTLAWIYLYRGRAWLDEGEDKKFSTTNDPTVSYGNAAESFKNAIFFNTGGEATAVLTDCAQAKNQFPWAELGCGVSYYRRALLLNDNSLLNKAEEQFTNIINNSAKVKEGYVVAKAYLNRGTIRFNEDNLEKAISDFQSSMGKYKEADDQDEEADVPMRFVAEAQIAYAKALEKQAEKIEDQETEEYTQTINNALTNLNKAIDLLEDNTLTEQDKRWFTYTIPIIKADALLRTAEITLTLGHDPTLYCDQVISKVYQSSGSDNTGGDTYELQKALDSAYAYILTGDYYQKNDPEKAKKEYNNAEVKIQMFKGITTIPDDHPLIADMLLQIRFRQCLVEEDQENCFNDVVNDEAIPKNFKASAYSYLGAMYLEKPFSDDNERCDNLDKAARYYSSCAQEAERDPVDRELLNGCNGEFDNINKEYEVTCQ